MKRSLSLALLLALLGGAAEAQEGGILIGVEGAKLELHVTITHIQFDHTKGGHRDGLTLRYNARKDLAHNTDLRGEWVTAGANQRNEPFAYRVNTTSKGILARAEARLVDPKTGRKVAPFTGTLTLRASSSHVDFPHVRQRDIDFVNGVTTDHNGSEYVALSLDTIHNPVLTADSVELTWALRFPGGRDWHVFQLTGPHPFFFVLATPNSPWYDVPAQNPWADALTFAIDTAGTEGLDDFVSAAEQLTRFLFSGHDRSFYHADWQRGIGYQTSGPGVSTLFNFTDYMADTSGKVVCRDQATALASCINILGGDAAVSELPGPFYIAVTDFVGPVDRCNNPYYLTQDRRGNDRYTPLPVVAGHLTERDSDGDGLLDRSGLRKAAYVLYGGKVYNASLGPYLGSLDEASYFAAAGNLPAIFGPRQLAFTLE